MLALYALDHDRTLYTLAADNARNIEARARNSAGLYLLSWNGETLPPHDARAGHAADAGRDDEPVRMAGGLPAAAAEAGAQTPSARRAIGRRRGPAAAAWRAIIARASRPTR